jgi:hypothetical protein
VGQGRGAAGALADRRGDYRGGVLLYAGSSTFGLGNARDLAVPLARLWDM